MNPRDLFKFFNRKSKRRETSGPEDSGEPGPQNFKKAPEVSDLVSEMTKQEAADIILSKYLKEHGAFRKFFEYFGIGQTNWIRTLEEVNRRRYVFRLHKERLTDIEHAKHEIAAVDIFVEKAQHFLELKSRQYAISSIITSTMIAIILAWDYYYLVYVSTIPAFFENIPKGPGAPEFGPYLFAMWVLRGSALSAISGAAIYFLGSLTRAFLHEATVFWNRRHAVRLGRLFIYLKFAGLSEEELPVMRSSLKIEDVERAFGWNLETSTAFKDMKPEVMVSKSIPGDPVKIFEAIANILKSAEPTTAAKAKKQEDKPGTGG